jgi:hypothetical protein
MGNTILPHGGKLVNRVLEGAEREEWIKKVKRLKEHLRLSADRFRHRTHIGRSDEP